MGKKGVIKTQQQYENEVELRNLYQEAFLRGEMTKQEAQCALVLTLGFSKTVAESLISKWGLEPRLDEAHSESPGAKKRRVKRLQSLIVKVMTRIYGKKPEKTQCKCNNCKQNKTCPVGECWERIGVKPNK